MSLFGNLKTEGLEQSEDRLGGGFAPIETDIYSGIVKAAYAGKSPGGAHSVSLIVDFNGREYRETVYITNKKGENFFLNRDDKTKKVPLPGFTLIDDLCLITTGKPLSEQDSEEKTIKLYDSDAKKELPKAVQMLIDLIGKPVSMGVVKQTVNKNVKDEASGEYVPTAEVRDENFTDKMFDTDTRMTVNEAKSGADASAFYDGWLERNKGKTRDKRTLKDGEAGAVGMPPKARPAANSAAPVAGTTERKSLFGKKAA